MSFLRGRWGGFASRRREECRVDVGVQIPLRSTVRAVGQMPRSGVAARSGNSSLSFLRNPHTVCHSSCPSLHAPQQCARVATAAHPHQHSSFFCVLFFLVAMVMGGSCWERGRVATGQLSAWDTRPWGPPQGWDSVPPPRLLYRNSPCAVSSNDQDTRIHKPGGESPVPPLTIPPLARKFCSPLRGWRLFSSRMCSLVPKGGMRPPVHPVIVKLASASRP